MVKIKNRRNSIIEKLLTQSNSIQERWNDIEQIMLTTVKRFRAQELAKDTYPGDDFLQSLIPSLRLELANLVINEGKKQEPTENWDMISAEILDYVNSFSNEDNVVHAVKRLRIL
jgi:hypothetical protein